MTSSFSSTSTSMDPGITSTSTREDQNNGEGKSKQLLGEGELGPAFLPALDNLAVEDYRRQYQLFRSGESKGAKGERPDLSASKGRRKLRKDNESS